MAHLSGHVETGVLQKATYGMFYIIGLTLKLRLGLVCMLPLISYHLLAVLKGAGCLIP